MLWHWFSQLGARARQQQAQKQLQLVSVLSLGQQQKVVVVHLEAGEHSARLVLGVSPQHMQCLHVLPAAPSYVPHVSSVTVNTVRTPGLS
jgi:flagellar biogenesis protein FliO